MKRLTSVVMIHDDCIKTETFLSSLWNLYRFFRVLRGRMGDGTNEDFGFVVLVLTLVDDDAGAVFTAFFAALPCLVPPQIGVAYD